MATDRKLRAGWTGFEKEKLLKLYEEEGLVAFAQAIERPLDQASKYVDEFQKWLASTPREFWHKKALRKTTREAIAGGKAIPIPVATPAPVAAAAIPPETMLTKIRALEQAGLTDAQIEVVLKIR